MPFCCCQRLWLLLQVGVVDGHQLVLMLVLMLVAPLRAALLASKKYVCSNQHTARAT
jgi:hypothetical protein